jgi:hypothetical protein
MKLLIERIALLDLMDLEPLLDVWICMIFNEFITDLVCSSTVQSSHFVCVEIVADDPISLDSQQGKIAGAVNLNWPSLVDKGVSDVWVA